MQPPVLTGAALPSLAAVEVPQAAEARPALHGATAGEVPWARRDEWCRLAHVDPIAYFADVLVRIRSHPARRIVELLPAHWAVHFARINKSRAAEPALA